MAFVAIDGEVENPREFSFEELRSIPRQLVERSTLLGGRAIGGVRLTALLEPLGIKPWARFIVVRSADGHEANIPLEEIRDCVLVYRIGDTPLPSELGGPLRLITRARGRYANVKVVALSYWPSRRTPQKESGRRVRVLPNAS